jgi:hypothetical protein
VHVIETELDVALPVQLWGPVKVMRPSAPTLLVNRLNGAANESAPSFSVAFRLNPASDASQCSATLHVRSRPDTPRQLCARA